MFKRYIDFLNEDRAQLHLPFNGYDDIQKEKPVYMHYIDWLETHGTYGVLGNNIGKTPREYVKEVIKKRDELITHISEYYAKYVYSFNDEFSKQFIYKNITQWFFDKIFIPRIENMLNNLRLDNNGHILIWRIIDIPRVGKVGTDFYKELNKEVGNGIGKFWTWDEFGGDNYEGSRFKGLSSRVKLCAKINTNDVNWLYTCILNGVEYTDEKEIRANHIRQVEIYNMELPNYNKVIPLKQPVLMKV